MLFHVVHPHHFRVGGILLAGHVDQLVVILLYVGGLGHVGAVHNLGGAADVLAVVGGVIGAVGKDLQGQRLVGLYDLLTYTTINDYDLLGFVDGVDSKLVKNETTLLPLPSPSMENLVTALSERISTSYIRTTSGLGKEIGTYVDYDLKKAEYTTGVTGSELYDLLTYTTINDYDLLGFDGLVLQLGAGAGLVLGHIAHGDGLAGGGGVGGGALDPITPVQAASMMMRALGYFQYSEDYKDGFETATVRQGTQIGIFEGIGSSADKDMTRGQVARMALNALESEMVTFTGTPGTTYTTSTGESITVGVAGANIGTGPGGHVPEGTAGLVILVVQLQQIGHNNGHLCAGDGPVRLKVASWRLSKFQGVYRMSTSFTFLCGNGRFSGFLSGFSNFLSPVVIVGNVGEARSTGSDNHHAQEHNGSQGQAESPLQVSHSDFLL